MDDQISRNDNDMLIGCENLYVSYALADLRKIAKTLKSVQEEIQDANVGDSISREAVKDKVNSWTYDLMEEDEVCMALHEIDELPSAHQIRCKDCKHWIPYDWMFSEVWRSKNINDYPEDEIGCAYCDMNMGANDFCSRAERKTDD